MTLFTRLLFEAIGVSGMLIILTAARSHLRDAHRDPIVLTILALSVPVVGIFASLHMVYMGYLISALSAYAIVDERTGYVFDRSLIPLVVAVALKIATTSIITAIEGVLVGFVMFWVPYWITNRRGMGFGDVKLGLLIGAMLGPYYAFMAFATAYVLGAIFGMIAVASNLATQRREIAFAPFMMLGCTAVGGWLIYAFS